MKNFATEFIGTFFLCLVVALNANAGVANLIAIGAVLMSLIYAGVAISGAHYNPAVTLSILMRRRIKLNDAVVYWLAQFLGAAIAAVVASKIFYVTGDGVGCASNTVQAIAGEFLGTFALVYVVLNVATTKALQGNSFYGAAIAFVVIGCGYVLGKCSGGAFNPAVAVSQSLIGFFAWSQFWIYFVGCFGGAIIGALVVNSLHKD